MINMAIDKPKYNIKTPHAAVIVFNYDDRIGSEDVSGVKDPNKLDKIIISTLSCVSIETTKTKSDPVGTFRLILAPSKNWLSTITSGSWCCIMMSNEPITESDIKKVNPDKLKMIGKIETVRAEVSVDAAGARNTLYYVTGVDWGYIFSTSLYIDNLLKEDGSFNSSLALYIRKNLSSIASLRPIREIIVAALGMIGKNPNDDVGGKEVKIAATYDLTMPQKLVDFLLLKNNSLSSSIDVYSGKFLSKQTVEQPDTYSNTSNSLGFIDPATLIGKHSYWQILLDNNNNVLNEMFCEMDFKRKSKPFILNARTKPFSYSKTDISKSEDRSLFQNIRFHRLNINDIIAINIGTNWRDKINFLELKPAIPETNIFDAFIKTRSQNWDGKSDKSPGTFNREGFRSMIVNITHLPYYQGTDKLLKPEDYKEVVLIQKINQWTLLLREWFFDIHRMLNGSITITGASNYISVGDNIVFEYDLINKTPNINKQSIAKKKNPLVVAHIENISHKFIVRTDGSKSYITQIDFVRGLLSDGENIDNLSTLDKFASDISDEKENNNNVLTSAQNK